MRTHGDARKGELHPLYIVWCGMKQRCENPNYKHYEDWGGRGIRILWTRYQDFKRDMLPTYKAGLQIERRNNNSHYCKENCCWATAKEQALNTRRSRILELDGIQMPMSLWAERIGVTRYVLAARIDRLGWSIREALTRPLRGSIRLKCHSGSMTQDI